jgi:hypothetical protein
MAARIDHVAKVAEMYKDGGRQVPYLTFMHIFNDLLSNRMAVVPREPSDELKDKFRAACMAVGLGVTDPEGRAEKRVEEFNTRVLPVWQQKLAPEEYREFEDIMRGGGLRRRRAPAQAEQKGMVGTSEKSSALLRRLNLVEDSPPPEEGPASASPPPAPPPEPAGQAPATFESMSDLCQAIRDGQVTAGVGEAHGEPFARYRISEREVSVRLAQASGQDYVVLTLDPGRGGAGGAPEGMDPIAAAMGYLRVKQGAYVRKGDDFVHTLKAMPNKISLASTPAKGALGSDLQAQLTKLQWDLGEILERMDA